MLFPICFLRVICLHLNSFFPHLCMWFWFFNFLSECVSQEWKGQDVATGFKNWFFSHMFLIFFNICLTGSRHIPAHTHIEQNFPTAVVAQDNCPVPHNDLPAWMAWGGFTHWNKYHAKFSIYHTKRGKWGSLYVFLQNITWIVTCNSNFRLGFCAEVSFIKSCIKIMKMAKRPFSPPF